MFNSDRISLAAVYYVCLIGVLIPALCFRSYLKLQAGAPFPKKPGVYQGTIFVLSCLFLQAGLIWQSFGLQVFAYYETNWKDAAIGTAFLALFLAVIAPRWKFKSFHERDQVYRMMPQSPTELAWWTMVSFCAGVFEEVIYRGVLFGIFMYWFGSWWVAALLCALAFALAHAIQGWKNMAIIFFMGLAFQGLVLMTGTLYMAMAVHTIYDFIAGAVFFYLWEEPVGEPV